MSETCPLPSKPRTFALCEIRVFILSILRGFGQVMFQGNALTGAFFLAGICWGAYRAGTPDVAVGAVIAGVVATITACLLGADREELEIGLHGYNGVLVGCAMPTFFTPTPLLWAYIVCGAMSSAVVMFAIAKFFRTWKVSAMTAPFVLTTWFLMLAAYNFGHLEISSLPRPSIAVQPSAAALFTPDGREMLLASLRGIAQVFLIDNMLTGILFLIGLAVSSVWAAVFAFAASVLAAYTALLLGGNTDAIIAGLFQFSAVLTAIGLGTTFYRPSLRAALFSVLGVIFTVILQGAMNVWTHIFGIPTLTFPFVVAAWLFLLPNIDLLPDPHRSVSTKE